LGIVCWAAAENVWNVDAPHLGQKDAPGLTSELQLEQYNRGGVKERPQPEQKVSPASYGVLQLLQRSFS
jgi:hypothetical protein